MTATMPVAGYPTIPYSMAPRILACTACQVQWDANAGTACWMCGGDGTTGALDPAWSPSSYPILWANQPPDVMLL